MNLFYDVSIGQSLLCIVFFGILVAVSILDLYKMKIPDYLCASILIIGIISIFFINEISILDRLIGFFAVSVPMFAITLLTKNGFGGGDIKLMACAGVFLGWKLVIVSMIIGLFIAGIYIIIAFATRNKSIRSGLALGPCLSIGMIISCMIGRQIWHIMF